VGHIKQCLYKLSPAERGRGYVRSSLFAVVTVSAADDDDDDDERVSLTDASGCDISHATPPAACCAPTNFHNHLDEKNRQCLKTARLYDQKRA